MNAGKQHGPGLLGALLGGDTDMLARLAKQAAEANRASQEVLEDNEPAVASIDIPQSAHDALRHGRVIDAVRHVRRANPGLDLKTAKDAVQALGRQVEGVAGKGRSHAALALARANRPPTVAPGDRGGARAVVYALALAGGALAWWMSSGG